MDMTLNNPATALSGKLARLFGSNKKTEGNGRLKQRHPVISKDYVAKFDGASMDIVDATGALVKRLFVKARVQTWESKDGSAGSIMQTKAYDVILQTGAVDASVPTSGTQVVIDTFDDIGAANQSFDRMADSLTSGMLGQTDASPVTVAAVAKRSIVSRVFRAVAPWIGGAVLMMVFSLYQAGMLTDGDKLKAAMQAQQPAGMQDSAAMLAAATGASTAGTPPAAWSALTQEQQQMMLKVAAQAAGAATGADVAVKPTFTNLSEEQLKKLKGADLLKLGKGKKVFYAFEDPMCPSCRHLAAQASKLDPSFAHIVVPIGFQTGARERAAVALCAKDPVADWKAAMGGQPAQSAACEEGYKKVDRNNKLFEELGMSSTPTLVGARGALIQGSGTTEQIATWATQNQ